jgi:hypothetical protein
MEINRKNFPGLYWLGRCFVSFLAAVIVMALLAPFSERLTAVEFSVALGVLWIVAVWANVPKWIAWCLDALWRIVAGPAARRFARRLRISAARYAPSSPL